METEELTKLVDGIYKNILEKFNPGARQMIMAGKAYLKALHGAATASKLYVDAVGKLGRQAQQGTWGGSADIGTALMKVVDVYREIQDQQMNTLKAFYVDLLVPLETNLEKDTKVIQSEQKRFLQQHKLRTESYNKAAAAIKKHRRKNARNSSKSGPAIDKEIKSQQILEEEKTKLDNYCEESLKNAMTQERRRYGFVLERQCSLAKHLLAYHTIGSKAIETGIESWKETAKTRETLPANVESMFHTRIRHVQMWSDDEVYASPATGECSLRKTRSVDASCVDVGAIIHSSDEDGQTNSITRAKSDVDLRAPTPSPYPTTESVKHQPQRSRPKSLAPGHSSWESALARALFAYNSSAENQLSLIEGDIVALLGERSKGWQYGENLRTRRTGWFPLAYTEIIMDDPMTRTSGRWSTASSVVATPSEPPPPAPHTHALTTPTSHTPLVDKLAPPRMFGDTIIAHRNSKHRYGVDPPPAPAPSVPRILPTSHSSSFLSGPTLPSSTTKSSSPFVEKSFGPSQTTLTRPTKKTPPIQVGRALPPASLHSSNDSGFANEPPPQPDVDYSDEDTHRLRIATKTTPGQISDEKREYLAKTQSLKRSPTLTQIERHGMNAHIPYNLTDKESVRVKRTKSFWKFGRSVSEEIMTGMALWQHRDLVDEKQELERRNGMSINQTIPLSATMDRKEIMRPQPVVSPSVNQTNNINGMSITHSEDVDSDEEGTLRRQRPDSRHSDATEASTIKTNFENSYYDDEGGFMVRTVKRRDILRRYDGSDDSGNDPYDSIVVADHAEPALRNGKSIDRNRKERESISNEKRKSGSHEKRDSRAFETREQRAFELRERANDNHERVFENGGRAFESRERKTEVRERTFEIRDQSFDDSERSERERRSSRATEKRETLPFEKRNSRSVEKRSSRAYLSESETLKRDKTRNGIEKDINSGYDCSLYSERTANGKRDRTLESRERNTREPSKRDRTSRSSDERRTSSNISDMDESSAYEYETDSRKAARRGACPTMEDAPQLLPRTRLLRQPVVTTFGPWYDLWPTNENAQKSN